MAKKLQRCAPSATAARSPSPSSPAAAAAPKKGGRVARDLVTEFTVQLVLLSAAGIPFVNSLSILEGQTRAGPFKQVLAEIGEDVAAGTPLSEAMAKHRCFDKLYTSMVRAGEVAGVLDKILNRLAIFREKAAAIRSKVIGAMIYPIIVTLVATGVVSAAILFVIPKFKEIFESFDTKLPAITNLLLNASAIGVRY